MANVQPITDDQELAKVLAGGDAGDNNQQAAVDTGISTLPPVPADPAGESTVDTSPEQGTDTTPPSDDQAFTMPEIPAPAEDTAAPSFEPSQSSDNLESIKASALEELRPLVDKLNVTPQEKFDVILLLLRSTDDSSLIEQAHAAAKNIVDETSRAQALLDVIKEIDFLSKPKQ